MATKAPVTGVVVSDKMDKTVKVAIERQIRDALYGKIQRRTSTFLAHDETNEAKVGDRVSIAETVAQPPQRWVVTSIVEKAKQLRRPQIQMQSVSTGGQSGAAKCGDQALGGPRRYAGSATGHASVKEATPGRTVKKDGREAVIVRRARSRAARMAANRFDPTGRLVTTTTSSRDRGAGPLPANCASAGHDDIRSQECLVAISIRSQRSGVP